MDTLATVADVAAALGLGSVDALTDGQKARAELLLAKVSRRFRLEAQRRFTPGTYTHYIKILDGAVRLEEEPDEVVEVKVLGANGDTSITTAYEVHRNWLHFTEYHVTQWSSFDDRQSRGLVGATAQITYSWERPVPADVVDAVADITARNLMLDPTSVVGQSKTLATMDYRQDVADWAAAGIVGMNDDDIELARSYRYPAPPSIVVRP